MLSAVAATGGGARGGCCLSWTPAAAAAPAVGSIGPTLTPAPREALVMVEPRASKCESLRAGAAVVRALISSPAQRVELVANVTGALSAAAGR